MQKLARLFVTFTMFVLSTPAFAVVVADKHTGNVIVSSKRNEISGGLLSSMHATAVFSKRKGYGIGVEYLTTGSGWAHFAEVWSNGKQYRYDAAAGRVLSRVLKDSQRTGKMIHSRSLIRELDDVWQISIGSDCGAAGRP